MFKTGAEARLAAIERFGLTTDQKDYTLERVVRIAAVALGARAGLFSVHLDNRWVHLAEFEQRQRAVGDPQFPVDVSEEASGPVFIHNLLIKPGWKKALAKSPLAEAQGYLAYPVLSPDKHPIGLLSMFFGQKRARLPKTTHRLMIDCVRLLEDALILRGLSVRDPLTHLFNRRYFTEVLDSEWRRAMRTQTPVSLALIDVDYFKRYNDAAGHKAGDEALRLVADVLMQNAKRAGDAVARYGGEEFVVLLPKTSSKDAVALIDRIRRLLEAKNLAHPGNNGLPLTFSAGVATAESSEELEARPPSYYLERADDALYVAKAQGRNRVCAFERGDKKPPAAAPRSKK